MKKVLISIGILMLFGCRGSAEEKPWWAYRDSLQRVHDSMNNEAKKSYYERVDSIYSDAEGHNDSVWFEATLAQIDSSIAYVRYNPEIKKWAVWGRDYETPEDWTWIQRYGGGTLQPDGRPTLYNTKQEAISVCLEYTRNFKRYNKDKALNDKITKGFL